MQISVGQKIKNMSKSLVQNVFRCSKYKRLVCANLEDNYLVLKEEIFYKIGN
jgi:hypothetical protein